MGIINVLDRHTAELIAAGEVVERPASIVKEMMENSIDAGADTVTVEIKNGGVTFIRVTDNGSGILRDDVRNAFKSHATSKIRAGEDLDSIGTLGFRGEALASVAAVARVELLTRCKNDNEGTHYMIEGGEETLFEESGCPAGTTLIVRDLFYNTPARMKFLKKDVSEANAVAVVVDKIALSHPELTVRFIRDGELRLLTPGNGDLKSVIYEVFDREFSANLIPVEYEYKGMGVNGYISRPVASRANRTLQNFFINGRYVRPRTCTAAIEEAYKGAIMTGKFPACVLFITMPNHAVDVNVHPAKLEVRFHSERDVFDAVYYAVKHALVAGDVSPLVSPKPVQPSVINPFSLKPDRPAQRQSLFESAGETSGAAASISASDLAPKKNEKFWQNVSYREPKESKSTVKVNDFTVAKTVDHVIGGAVSAPETKPNPKHQKEDEFLPRAVMPPIPAEKKPDMDAAVPAMPPNTGTEAKPDSDPDTEKAAKYPENETKAAPAAPTENSAAPQSEPAEAAAPGRIIGELFDTYILVESGSELLMVDKHAAHERYIYEQLKARGQGAEPQLLLVPETVSLSREEHLALINGLDAANRGGFEIEDFGDTEVIVRAAPMWTEKADIADIVRWMAGALMKGADVSVPDFLDELYHSIACRSAVKAHDKSTPGDLKYIVDFVAREDIRYCPHGRPVVCSVTRRQIEKMFKRIV